MEPRILSASRTPEGCELRLVEYPPGLQQRAHAHERGSITLVLRGALVERTESGEERASALSVVAKPAGFEHSDTFGPGGATTLQVELPGPGATLPGAAAPAVAARWDHAGPACRAMLRLPPLVARGVPTGSNPSAGDLVREALATMAPRPRRGGAAPAWLYAVRSALAEEGALVATVAARVGVHPVYLARRFRQHFGLTPSDFRARMRVRRAAHAIAGAREPLATVALDAGFCDQAHMSRDVRSATGMSPRELRRLALGVGAVRG